MKKFLVLLALLAMTCASNVFAQKQPAPTDKVVPYRDNYICLGKWVAQKRQQLDDEGHSINRIGYRCVDNTKSRRDAAEKGGQ